MSTQVRNARASENRPLEQMAEDGTFRAELYYRLNIYGPQGAAALLGLKPTTLQGKLRRYGLR